MQTGPAPMMYGLESCLAAYLEVSQRAWPAADSDKAPFRQITPSAEESRAFIPLFSIRLLEPCRLVGLSDQAFQLTFNHLGT